MVPAPPISRRPDVGGWDTLLVCVAACVATGVGRVHEIFPVLLPLKPALIAAILAVVLYVLQQSGPRRIERLQSRVTNCLIGLLLWAALGLPAALNQGVAFQTLTDFLKTVLLFGVLAGSVRGVRDVERLVLVYFAATVVYAAVVLSRFQVGGDSWRLGDLYDYDANDFATLIATAIPLGLYFILAQRRLLWRSLAAAGVAVLAVGEIHSGSRGGFLALLAVALVVLLGFTTLPARSRMMGLVAIVCVIVATASDKYWTQMQTMFNPDHDYNATSEGGRLKIWGRGLGYMTAYPVLGVGAGDFPVAEGTISPFAKLQQSGIGVRWGAAHNSFIEVGAELGIPGLVLFVGFIASTLVLLRRVARTARAVGPPAIAVARLAQSLTAALIGFAVGAFFLSLAYADMLYTLAALAVGLGKIAGVTVASRVHASSPRGV